MIRRATEADIPALTAMGQRFVQETSYKDLVSADPDRIAQTVIGILSTDTGVVLVSEGTTGPTGMIAMLSYSHPFSGELTAFEVVWWVNPEARGDGIRLLKAAEDWGRQKGATKMNMVAPNERVGALYSRLGYSPVETSFQRSL